MPDSAPPPDGPGGLPGDLRDALGRLTQAEREIVALRVVLGLDAAEAGRVAGMTPSAVGTALHRALGKLRAEVVRP
ncbi:MAG: sigma factor-like helix-turn-helix DNA-binding protein [Thermoleophilia bacterium]